jgi:hypothetical protein
MNPSKALEWVYGGSLRSLPVTKPLCASHKTSSWISQDVLRTQVSFRFGAKIENWKFRNETVVLLKQRIENIALRPASMF